MSILGKWSVEIVSCDANGPYTEVEKDFDTEAEAREFIRMVANADPEADIILHEPGVW